MAKRRSEPLNISGHIRVSDNGTPAYATLSRTKAEVDWWQWGSAVPVLVADSRYYRAVRKTAKRKAVKRGSKKAK